MIKAKQINTISFAMTSLKYIFMLYIIFLAVLLRSPLFYFTAALLYLGYFIYLTIKFKKISNVLFYFVSDYKYLKKNVWNFIKEIKIKRFKKILFEYKAEIVICFIYIGVMSSVISWGLPNNSHPFPYYMDESHSLQAVKTVVRYGSSNLPHQEVGPMFNYIVSAVLVSPLFVFRLINPSAITTAISALIVQAQLYIALRAITVMFGLFSLIIMVRISKIFKINSALVLELMVATPVFISISNYFKYDMALLFWIFFSILLIFNYSLNPTKEKFIFAGIASALAISTKVTGISVLFIYIFSFFYFTPNFKDKFKTLFTGIFIYFVIFAICGIPDIIFGGRSMSEYLYYNIFSNPQNDRTFNFGVSHFQYTFSQLLPAIFGHGTFALAVVSFIYLILKILLAFVKGNYKNIKKEIFLIFCLLIFAASLTPLYIIAANRAMVLLPFFAIIIGIFVRDVYSRASVLGRNFIILLVIFVLFSQIVETYAWISIKYDDPPQVKSSKWVVSNISKGTTIGIENIPVYEMLPDIVVREFYENQYKVKKKYKYKYEIIDYKSAKLPSVIIISNAQFEYDKRKTSVKKSLVKRLYKEGYHEIAGFSPSPEFYKLYTNDINFVMVGMTAVPKRISVFKKN